MRSLPVIVPALMVLALAARCAPTDAGDRAAMLAGVDTIVASGAIPGDVVVSGDGAFVVMVGRSGRACLPMVAASRYGRGRAIVAGHEGFFGAGGLADAANRRLAVNIAGWAGRRAVAGLRVGLCDQDAALGQTLAAAGAQGTTVRISDLPAALASLDILWLNQASLDGRANEARLEALRKWVAAGGAVVVTGPAWGWQSLHPALDLARDHSGSNLVRPMGLAFGAGMLETTAPAGYAAGPEPPALADARLAVAALKDKAAGRRDISPEDIEQITATIGQALGALPEDAALARETRAVCAGQGGDLVATRQTPITTAMPFARLEAALDARRMRRLAPDQVKAHPAAASFPGAVPAGAKRVTVRATVDTAIPGWHGVGLYAAPGEVVTVTVPAEAAGKGLAARIGAHTDTLWHLEKWERFPEVSMSRPMDAAQTKVASPFGGTIYVEVPDGCRLGGISVTVANAVAAPRFVRGVTPADAWRTSLRSAPGPWAELEGKRVILTVPSTAVRDLDDPEALMAYWDEVVERCSELYAAPRRSRPERYCVDRQISAGYMHSGYPIMTGDDVARTFCDLKTLRGDKGLPVWGFYHELGHNFQRPEWTWSAWGEVTNNLFSLYGAERLNGVMAGAHPAMTDAEIAKRVTTVAGAPGKERYYERDPWYPLTMLYLIRRELGWEPFTKVFAEFGALRAADRPRTEEAKHDQLLTRLSRATGRNLGPYLAAWGVDVSPSAQEAVASLPAWMPKGWR